MHRQAGYSHKLLPTRTRQSSEVYTYRFRRLFAGSSIYHAAFHGKWEAFLRNCLGMCVCVCTQPLSGLSPPPGLKVGITDQWLLSEHIILTGLKLWPFSRHGSSSWLVFAGVLVLLRTNIPCERKTGGCNWDHLKRQCSSSQHTFCQITSQLVGLFWWNSICCTAGIPSEQTSSLDVILHMLKI